MTSRTDLPGMVPGSPPTARNIPRAGTRAWQRRLNGSTTQRLVGGVFLLLSLLVSAPAAADTVRLAWLPVGEFAPAERWRETDSYIIEREVAAGWDQVTIIQHDRKDPHWDERSGVFRLEVRVDGAPGRWRLFAVDQVGNFSRPTLLQPAPTCEPEVCVQPTPTPTCTWEVAGYRVPVRCERACSCDVVVQRLNVAREDLRTAGVLDKPELLDQGLSLTTIEIVGPERLATETGRLAGGAWCEGSILLAVDMRGAAHEMFHLYEHAAGKAQDPRHQHDAWDRDPRLRAIDTKHRTGGWQR